MERRSGFAVTTDAEALHASIPSARNPWFIVSAIVFGIPWLVVVVAGAIVGVQNIPDSRTALVWTVVALGVLALTGLLDVVALMTIWLAVYTLKGTETLDITRDGAALRRAVWGIGWRWRFGRGLLDHVVRLDPSLSPGRVPHPTLELDLGRSRARLGAGLAPEDADRLAVAISAFLSSTGPDATEE